MDAFLAPESQVVAPGAALAPVAPEIVAPEQGGARDHLNDAVFVLSGGIRGIDNLDYLGFHNHDIRHVAPPPSVGLSNVCWKHGY